MTQHKIAKIDGLEVFYREAGPADAPVIVLLHGFPSSSHMFRDLIPKLAGRFRVIAPDLIGFGYSARPPAGEFEYTFDRLAAVVERLLVGHLALDRFTIYMHDYGAPVGFRIASRHPGKIAGIIVQNGNAYVEGISPAFEPLKPFWAGRNPETEKPARWMLTLDATRFQYLEGVRDRERVSPDGYMLDQLFLDRPGSDAIQLDLMHNYPSNLALYDSWHDYLRGHQPPALIVWGKNDPFFTVEGARAFLRDLPQAELLLLDTGHFALEDHAEVIASAILRVFHGSTQEAAQ